MTISIRLIQFWVAVPENYSIPINRIISLSRVEHNRLHCNTFHKKIGLTLSSETSRFAVRFSYGSVEELDILKLLLLSFPDNEDIALDTVVTETILATTASICRVLSRNESHLLLAGATGCGLIDSLHIATTYLGVKLMSITPIKNYDISDFYSDLKMVACE